MLLVTGWETDRLWKKQEGGEGAFVFVPASGGEIMRTLSLAEITGVSPGMAWSPDGRLIACGGTAKQKRRGVFLITVETGDVRLLTPLEKAPNSLTWSPDGKVIAYGQNNGVYVVNVEDGKPRQIASPTEKEEIFNRPFFASDGSSVAYAHLKGPNCDTVLATTIDGKQTREICHVKDAKLNMRVFSLSPDGRRIVFTPGDEKIWCAPTDGGEPFLMGDISDLGKTVFVWGAEWSPKGDAISFGVGREEYQYWVMENFLPVAKAGRQ